MRCLAEGDQHALRAMQFRAQEIEALRELNLADLYRVGALQAHCLSIALDRDVFWPMIANLRATRENEELQRDLIQADAPLEMMRSLFGIGSREYTRLRRMLAVGPAVGRPPEPDEETGHRLWHALSARLTSAADEEIDPKGVPGGTAQVGRLDARRLEPRSALAGIWRRVRARSHRCRHRQTASRPPSRRAACRQWLTDVTVRLHGAR